MRKSPNRPINRTMLPQTAPALTLDQSINALDTPERIIAYCRSAGLINGTETDIEALIRATPELVLSFEAISPNDAYIQKLDDGRYKIAVNSAHPRNRQRFSMAHEYIHYQMHRPEIENMPLGERIMHRNDERNRIEYQANQYAGAILMPEDTFKETIAKLGGNVEKIASAFGVSTLAARFRARDLGISGHGL